MKLFLFLSLLLAGLKTQSQTIDSFEGKFQYYLFIKGVKSKSDVIQIEELVRKKPGVKLFISDRFPVRFFLMKSDIEISKTDFQNWIGEKYALLVYGLGYEYKEAAIMAAVRSTH